MPARRGRASERVSRVHVDTAGPMPIVLASEREYGYVVVDDYSRAVYRRPLRDGQRAQIIDGQDARHQGARRTKLHPQSRTTARLIV